MTILLLLLFSMNANAQNNNNAYLNKITSFYKKVQFYDLKFAKSGNDKDLNELMRNNKALLSLIGSDGISRVQKSDLKKISKATGLKIIYSKDESLKSISWAILNNTTEPQYANVLFITGKSYKIISQNGTGSHDFGENFGTDSIIEKISGGKNFYLLIGSKKCGNICIQKSIQLYLSNDKSIRECANAFFDGTEHFNRVVFQYFLSEETKMNPSFEIHNKEIFSPIFSSDKLIKTGVKKYFINYCL